MDISTGVRAFADRERSMITTHIRRHGVHLTYISPDLGGACECGCQEGRPVADVGDQVAEQLGGPAGLPPRLSRPFCYTTGLYGIGHPELVVLGLPQDASMALLNTAAHQISGHHLDLVSGQLVPHLEPHAWAEEIPNPGMVIFQANNYYDRPLLDSVPAYQLTWADRQGRFPWDDGHISGPWIQPRPGAYRA